MNDVEHRIETRNGRRAVVGEGAGARPKGFFAEFSGKSLKTHESLSLKKAKES